MGYETRRIEVVVSLSRHNSDEDERDDQLFDDLLYDIKVVAGYARYKPLGPMVF